MLGIYRQSVLGRMILGPALSSSLQGIVRIKEGQVFVRTLECTTASTTAYDKTYGKLFKVASERISQNPHSFKGSMIPWGQQMPGKSPMLPLHRLRLPQETATQLYLLAVGEGHCQIPPEVSSAARTARTTFFEALLVTRGVYQVDEAAQSFAHRTQGSD